MVSEGGSCDFDIEVGIDNAAIPASILRRWNALVNHRMKDYDVTYWCAFGLSPLRMYSAGTFASSGATAMIASRDTSRKGGRARIRGSWTVGVGIGLVWWWWWGANEVGWDATCNMTYDEEEESEELWTDYIEVAYVEIVSQPILGHSFMCGVSLGLACYVVSITHCTLCKRLVLPVARQKIHSLSYQYKHKQEWLDNLQLVIRSYQKNLCNPTQPMAVFMGQGQRRRYLNTGSELPFKDIKV